MNSGHSAWEIQLMKWAQLIYRGEFPSEWIDRVPSGREIRALLSALLRIELNVQKSAKLLHDALIAADKKRGGLTFQENSPVTFFIIEQYMSKGSVSRDEVKSFRASLGDDIPPDASEMSLPDYEDPPSVVTESSALSRDQERAEREAAEDAPLAPFSDVDEGRHKNTDDCDGQS